jgi:serine phosphatase RsbU (regulator of sigma subunit)
MTMQFRHGTHIRPALGFAVGGDAAVIQHGDRGVFLAIIDALGHGPEAHEEANHIADSLSRTWSQNLDKTLAHMHETLQGRRGAAVGFCFADYTRHTLEYVGVGNTVARCWSPKETRLISREGVLGQTLRSPFHQEIPVSPGAMLVLYTDGVRTHFSEDEYPGIRHDRPELAARRVVERFGKDHDDAGCIVLRCDP